MRACVTRAAVESVEPEDAVISVKVPPTNPASGSVRDNSCVHGHYFSELSVAQEWRRQEQPDADLVPVREAFQWIRPLLTRYEGFKA